jgi:polysaccharide export outer membrane protein
MNLTRISRILFGRSARLFALLTGLACAFASPLAHAADAGSVTGSVSNTATGNLLEGARITVPALGLNALTDNSGRFVLAGVPAGTHEVLVSYIGLDSVRAQVTVSPGQRAVRDFDLTTGVYKLEAFKVSGEREGGAAAITAQRNAPNHTNVVSMDSFGNLPNMSAGEVLMRLPGVAGSPMQPQSGFEVDQSGMLDFPYAGKLKVSGLTSSEIHTMLTTRLAHYLRQPKLSVRLLAYRSKRVYVDGEVKLPGVQAINDLPMTLTEAINRSGGMNPTADQSRITLSRAGKSYAINLPLLVQRGMNPSDILLKNGDVVRVLARDENKIFVSGEVSGPRALPLRNGRLTLNEALGEAGGINPVTGDARQVYVIRRSSSESRVYQLDANSPGALAVAESFELSPKDVVYVAATPLTNWNRTISALIPGALPGAVIAGTPGR